MSDQAEVVRMLCKCAVWMDAAFNSHCETGSSMPQEHRDKLRAFAEKSSETGREITWSVIDAIHKRLDALELTDQAHGANILDLDTRVKALEKPADLPAETELDFEVRLVNLEKRMRQRQQLTERVEALERHIASHAQGARMHEEMRNVSPAPEGIRPNQNPPPAVYERCVDVLQPKPAATVGEIERALFCGMASETSAVTVSEEILHILARRGAQAVARMKEEGRL